MKKLSLVLAIVLILTCGVLAACNSDETTSEAVSSEAESKAESKVESTVESSEAESSEEASSEAVSEEASSEAPAINAGDTNLAAGKAYTTDPLFRQGGAPDYNYDPNAEIAYPDSTGKEMTDGTVAAIAVWDDFWADNSAIIGMHTTEPSYAANGNYACITVDLGEAADLAKFVAQVTNLDDANSVASFSVAVSADGETWNEVGSTVTTGTGAVAGEVALSEAVNAQYVQFRFVGGGHWIFVSEVEVYGAAE